MSIIQAGGGSPLAAWRDGAEKLTAANGELCNLLTIITNPTQLDNDWISKFTPRNYGVGYDDIRDVIDTIFRYH